MQDYYCKTTKMFNNGDWLNEVWCVHIMEFCVTMKKNEESDLWTDRERFLGDIIKWIKKQKCKFPSIVYYILCKKEGKTRIYVFIFLKKGNIGSARKHSWFPVRNRVGWEGMIGQNGFRKVWHFLGLPFWLLETC